MILFDRDQPAVEAVKLGLIVFRPLGHFGRSTQACEDGGDVLFRTRVELIRTSFAAGHNVWISQLIRVELQAQRIIDCGMRMTGRGIAGACPIGG